MNNADEQDEPRQPDEILPVSADALSPSETEELSRCEQIIDQGLRTFFEVGAALLRDTHEKLSRVTYQSCKLRIGALNTLLLAWDAAGD
jgi:hypothetical protein